MCDVLRLTSLRQADDAWMEEREKWSYEWWSDRGGSILTQLGTQWTAAPPPPLLLLILSTLRFFYYSTLSESILRSEISVGKRFMLTYFNTLYT